MAKIKKFFERHCSKFINMEFEFISCSKKIAKYIFFLYLRVNQLNQFWKLQKAINKNCKIVANPQFLLLHLQNQTKNWLLRRRWFLPPGDTIFQTPMKFQMPSKMMLSKLKIILLPGKEISSMICLWLTQKLIRNQFWRTGFTILRAQKWTNKIQTKCWKISKEIKDDPRKITNNNNKLFILLCCLFFPAPTLP